MLIIYLNLKFNKTASVENVNFVMSEDDQVVIQMSSFFLNVTDSTSMKHTLTY